MALETATNPNTGERVALVNGQWQPIAQTATNKEGKKAYLVGEQWLTDESSLPEVTVTPDSMTVSEVPGPRGQPPAWAKDFPGLYQGAQTARQMLGPTVEAGGAVAGGLVGSLGGPAGTVMGSAAGYGLGAGALRQADIALGNISDMTPAQGLEAGTRDLLMGAIYEAGGRVAAPYIDKALQLGGRGVGWLYDTLSGQIGVQKAAKILRDSLGVDVAAARTAARNAPVDVTAAQSIAGLTSPTTQALLEQAAKRDPRYLLSTAEAQDAARINQLAELAGAETQTGAKGAQQAAKKDLRNQLLPTLKQEMEAANVAGVLEPQLRAQAERMGAVAGQKVEDVRRFSAVPPGTLQREPIVGLVPPEPMAVPAGTRLLEKGQQKSIELGRPVSTGRYTYEGELAKRADDVATKAAEGSLIFGEASRFATAAANSLEAHGLKPLKGDAIVSSIERTLADPKLAPGNRDLQRALGRVASDIKQWTNAGGVIDAWALDTIRKNSVNSVAKQLHPNDAKAQKELAGKVLESVRPTIVKAVEDAGGTGYGAYLEAYSTGLKAVSEKKLSAKALDMYQNDPKGFVKLVEGNNPKEVEKTFGAGSYDIAKEMSDKAMATLKSVAGELKRDIRVGEQAAAGRDALRELLEANQSRFRLPSFALSRTVTATNTALDALEAKLGKAVMNKLTEASKSGQDMAKLLDTLPAVERNKVLRAFNNPQEWMVMPKEGRGAAAVNMLAPESENNLGK
jgi:hypothetical protein